MDGASRRSGAAGQRGQGRLDGRWAALAALVLLVACRSTSLPEVTVSLDAGVAPIATAPASPEALRVAVAAMLSPERTFSAYARLVERLSQDLGQPVTLTQRTSYRETNELLKAGRVDVAFVCTGGYADLLRQGEPLDVLAVPQARGATTYQSYLIVSAASGVERLEQLEGKRFAFTDELSLSGYAYPVWAARQRGFDPLRFFAAAYFTHSHDRSIQAVARGLVDGAAVDGHIFDALVLDDPELARQVRVIKRSEPLGIPPVVAPLRVDPLVRRRVREALLSLHESAEGRALLGELGFDRYTAPPPGLYDTALEVVREVEP